MERITRYLIKSTVNEKGVVRAWEEEVLLPTYGTGKEEKNPIFLEKRVYQGSSGSVYPYPVVEKICDEKTDKPYRALFIENEYIKVMVLPQLGGRIQMAYDKIRRRHFVYYNQVIKPALVGLTGPWISGGIEFNWPQHHRPSTFLPLDYLIEENGDGSKTLWCNEIERMTRTKGRHGITLYPDRAYIEVNVKIYNRTDLPQTFLWWANPAVPVDDSYRSVFPADVHAVFDHGKRDVSDFPVARGVYYKHDYSAGVDISRYSNIPVPTSYMAIRSRYDFVGGYNEAAGAGLLHVADHRISPGKKQWTWGNGDFGQAWDRNLTDNDGPYIELMTGVYTDNQPDFSWLHPYEQKSWRQYFMPYGMVGSVKNATKDAVANVETADGKTCVTVYTTSYFKDLTVRLSSVAGDKIAEITADISPEEPFTTIVDTGKLTAPEILFELLDPAGSSMLSYRAEEKEIRPVPDPAEAAPAPADIGSVEQLYHTGLHIEQYRHATYNPVDYYSEGLRREPGNVSCNNAMGLVSMRRGEFALAESYFRTAVETLTRRNPNPRDGEPFYNLGCSLTMQGKNEEAYDAYYKATWNGPWQDAAYYSLARIDCMNKDYPAALEKVERSLSRNRDNHKARRLKTSLLRLMGHKDEAMEWAAGSLARDPFNAPLYMEQYLATGERAYLQKMKDTLRGNVHSYIEYSLDYIHEGLYGEAETMLSEYIRDSEEAYPMAYYTMGYAMSRAVNGEKAKEYCRLASRKRPDGCFPNRTEELNILLCALSLDPADGMAAYYLGNFFYSVRRYDEAIKQWERAAELTPGFPTVLRNLALAYYNKRGEKALAREFLEKALSLDPTDSRILMELDLLYKKTGIPHSEKLTFLESHPDVSGQRDDLALERITLYNQTGNFSRAIELLSGRKFHPWEGGEGKVTRQYVISHVELAKQAIACGRYEKALRMLNATDRYPENLGEGKLRNSAENEIAYYKGVALEGIGDMTSAALWYLKATRGSDEPQQGFFYNDPQPDHIFYRGMAWRRKGDREKSLSCFNKLVAYGEKHLFDECRIDYFAVSLPDLAVWEEDLDVRNKVHCNYLMGLGHLGLGDTEKAVRFLREALSLDINHQGAGTHLALALDKSLMEKLYAAAPTTEINQNLK